VIGCLVGIVTGVELLCRMSLVAPMGAHKAGFHPTAVYGAVAAAGAVGAALQLPAASIGSALGIAGSMASGIIEYLAEGTWTKRMHAGWSAQSGVRAALMARAGFLGPRTVLDGAHGFYRAFAPSVSPRFGALTEGLGARWVTEDLAFKPYACGTMTQPFIDCAIALAESGVGPDEIREIVCEVGEGTVHRLWEPLDVKRRPPTGYAAKFSTPYCMAVGFLDRRAGSRSSPTLAFKTGTCWRWPARFAIRSIRQTNTPARSPATCVPCSPMGARASSVSRSCAAGLARL